MRSDTIRQVKAAITNGEIQQNVEFDDAQVEEVINKIVRQHRESIEAFRKGNRQDLIDKEEAELTVLLPYLPEQMSSEAIEQLVQKTVEEIDARGPADKGRLMGRLMPQLKGKADGNVVNTIVTQSLEKLGP
ncbi:GatB/YqeY domain-containing protein [Dehalococcoidia bacterium]|nr:GatB/YqeY domain-containing protein [Dehalococcoidia bacterium]